jgi:hypothetical protein
MTHELDQLAAERRTTRSEVIRLAVEEFLTKTRQGKSPDRVDLVNRLVTYTGSGQPDLGRNSKKHLQRLFGERRKSHRR